MAKSLVIDFHAHMLEKDVLAQAQGKTVLSGFGTRPPPIVTGPARTAMFEKIRSRTWTGSASTSTSSRGRG